MLRGHENEPIKTKGEAMVEVKTEKNNETLPIHITE